MQDHRLRAVCPVNCFYEGENMLVIHPDECIDCGVCEPECPVDAIKPDSEFWNAGEPLRTSNTQSWSRFCVPWWTPENSAGSSLFFLEMRLFSISRDPRSSCHSDLKPYIPGRCEPFTCWRAYGPKRASDWKLGTGIATYIYTDRCKRTFPTNEGIWLD